MKPISVIMSVYNEPMNWLASSIESILNQTFTDFEFIIVNDNPEKEKLKDFLSQYRTKDSRIRVLENPKNIGLTKSLNIAIKAAKGQYLSRMDGDDISAPERLKSQYEFLEKNTDIFLVGTSVQIIDKDGALKEKIVKHNNHKQIVNDIFNNKLSFYHPTIMFRNEVILYREKFETTQDFDLYLTLLSESKKFSNLRQILLYYRLSHQSISMTKRRRQLILKKLALKFYSERITTGKDSYDRINFGDESQIFKFLSIDPDCFDKEALREQIVFALGGTNYPEAKQAFKLYKRYKTTSLEKLILWTFVHFPLSHRLYRKLRYQYFSL